MPLLLRRSAPSPSIDELAFAVPAAPLTASAAVAAASNSSGNFRSSTGSEMQFPQLQRCSTHNRMSMMRRRSTASNDTEMSGLRDSCVAEECSDPHHLHHLQENDTCKDDEDQDAASRSSKRSTQTDQQDDEDTSTSEWGYGSENGRPSSAPSCSCSCRDDDMCGGVTASTVVIEDKQLAVVDMELRDLRKTFAKKLYTRLTKMSQTFGRKRGSSNPQLKSS
uniref:Uncharacterized protein n=1 Tax=Globisporangium ultimum (strain ATCC 200006 / CBS 805.95 / DAOM BR144) TaxID=431595 RepID=K3X180_GLOUD